MLVSGCADHPLYAQVTAGFDDASVETADVGGKAFARLTAR